jgi:hypothetical protein
MRIELSFLVPPAADIPFLWQLRKGTSFAMCSAGVKYDAFIGDSRLAFILEAGHLHCKRVQPSRQALIAIPQRNAV